MPEIKMTPGERKLIMYGIAAVVIVVIVAMITGNTDSLPQIAEFINSFRE